MARFLRQSTSTTVRMGPFVSPADGYSAATGLSGLTVKGSKNGGTLASAGTFGAHDADGYYSVSLATGDTDTIGRLRLTVAGASSYAPVWEDFVVLSASVYDVLFGSTALSTYAGTDTSGTTTLLSRIGSALTISSGKVAATLAAADVSGNVAADLQTIKTQTVTCSGGVTVRANVGTATAALTVDASGNVTVAGYASGQAPLQPTVAGRTLDVTTTGEAGIDWGNIGNASATVSLSTTTIATVTNVTNGVTVSGNVTVGGYAAGQAPLQPTVSGRTLDVSTGGEAGLDWANIGSATTTVNLSGTTVKTATDVETDTADIQTRLPAALTAGGNIKADALAISGDTTAADNCESFFDGTGYAGTNNVIPTVTSVTNGVTVTTNNDKTGYRLSATGVDDIWDEVQSGHTTAGTFGKYLDAAVSGVSTGGVSAADIADAVWDEARTGHNTSGTFGETVTSLQARLPGSGTISSHTAADVWTSGGRTLTAGTNIVLAKGTNITGFNDLDASGIRSAVGLGAANLDTQLTTIDDFLDTEIVAIKAVTDKLDTALELDGSVYRYTTNALEQAPSGGGGGTADWTSTEREQIRHRLGIDGTATAPSSGTPSLATPATVWSSGTRTLTAQSDSSGVTTLLSRVGSAITISSGKVATTLAAADVSGNLPANVTTMTSGVITDSSFSVPSEFTGRPTGVLGMVRRMFEKMSNKKTRDRSTGVVLLRNEADTTTLETQTQATVGTLDSITKGV